MTDRSTPTGAAASKLYEASQVLVDMITADDGTIAAGKARHKFFKSVCIAALYVAQKDVELSPKELWAINDIFWLAQLPPPLEILQTMIDDSDNTKRAVEHLEETAAMIGKRSGDGTSNIVLEATEQVLQAVLAHDGSVEPEVKAMTEIVGRIRRAAGITAVPLAFQSADVSPILASLDELVGLESVKEQVETLTNLAKVFSLRRKMGMSVPDMSLHLVFLGNPGTGKTTVARIIAQLYGKLGLLSKGHLVEVDRSGLVAEYIGQTAVKTNEVITSALGGVLFIDEAYALDNDAENDFGREAVATLLKAMEDHREDLVVIAAGYTKEMQGFLNLNPGLRSRMPRDIEFHDYSPQEMVEIFHGMVGANDYKLPADCDVALLRIFHDMHEKRQANFANARDVRNLFEETIGCQANRVGGMAVPTLEDLNTITIADLTSAFDDGSR